MYVNFEFAALLPSTYSRVKKCAKFKTNIHLVSVDSFLYYLSCNSFLSSRSIQEVGLIECVVYGNLNPYYCY